MPTRSRIFIRQTESTYSARILKHWGGCLVSYLPMGEASGTTLRDLTGNGRNGVISGSNPPTLRAAGIGDGLTGVTFGGTAESYIAWGSSGMYSAFNASEGSLLVWLGGMTGATWDDGTVDNIFYLYVDANNNISIYKRGSPIRELIFKMVAGGTTIFRVITAKNPNWFRAGFTWSKSNNRIRCYINGKQYQADLTGLGNWAGTPSGNYPLLGADFVTGGSVFKGTMAHAVLLNREASAAEIDAEYRLIKSPLNIGIIGDSISAYTSLTSFTWQLRDQYNLGNCQLYNHAVSGQTIINHLDAQTAAAATDNASIIILQLGTNDTSATGIQAKVESNITTLRGTNPAARIFYMNILPRWTDATGATPVDKSAIRTAIASACTAQNITCWDTYAAPWIAVTDTIDGLHPNDSGHAKILTEILARLP